MHFHSVASTLFALAIAVSATPIPEAKNYLAARDALAELQPRKFRVCAPLFANCGITRGKLPCCANLYCKSGACASPRIHPTRWGY
ncbi:uncharacterized protein LY79DRAFT_534415 [Colletotrichum navitas]|uniref:Uncharacterized protein n=1 Tax=Colletotrichum navitas TaxID=681940 RepID=A0AAD8QDK1_9PEZI|nr:uncharacterized protein LY79DRAFT_534415 [Colletotrichum navitas]KAK1600683.1 hypothetical protein LY79DRAFT_534415 [Colletotrichum navitas]